MSSTIYIGIDSEFTRVPPEGCCHECAEQIFLVGIKLEIFTTTRDEHGFPKPEHTTNPSLKERVNPPLFSAVYCQSCGEVFEKQLS